METLGHDILLYLVDYLDDIKQVQTLLLCFRSLRECLKKYSCIKERIMKRLEKTTEELVLPEKAIAFATKILDISQIPRTQHSCIPIIDYVVYTCTTKFDYRGKPVYKVLNGGNTTMIIEYADGMVEHLSLYFIQKFDDRNSFEISLDTSISCDRAHGESVFARNLVHKTTFFKNIFQYGTKTKISMGDEGWTFDDVVTRQKVENFSETKCQAFTKRFVQCARKKVDGPFCRQHAKVEKLEFD